jgi:hypothetical protein
MMHATNNRHWDPQIFCVSYPRSLRNLRTMQRLERFRVCLKIPVSVGAEATRLKFPE